MREGSFHANRTSFSWTGRFADLRFPLVSVEASRGSGAGKWPGEAWVRAGNRGMFHVKHFHPVGAGFKPAPTIGPTHVQMFHVEHRAVLMIDTPTNFGDNLMGVVGAMVRPVASPNAHELPLQGLTVGQSLSIDKTAKNASWGNSTVPTAFMRFLPSFCFSRSLRLREMSPP